MAPPKDAKTLLQEVAHAKGLGVPVYEVIGREGSEHQPIFSMKVTVGEGLSAIGKGRCKKLAQFSAASKLLRMI